MTQRNTPKEINQSATPDALKNFDSLPDSAQVRLPVVMALFACSSVTVWRMTKNSRIPPPQRLTPRHVSWNVGGLRKALAALG